LEQDKTIQPALFSVVVVVSFNFPQVFEEIIQLVNWVETTLPETNITPENQWLEDEISFWDALFSGAMLVSWRVANDCLVSL